MTIVSDTTPLRYLVEIEEVNIIQSLFGRIMIPERVAEELQHAKTPRKVREWIQSSPEWIQILKADTSLFVPRKVIHSGEHESIALALQVKAHALLCDDSTAILEASRVLLPTIRLFSILERAAEVDLIDLSKVIEKIARTTFHAPPQDIIDAILERDAHRKATKT